jgi:NitT/TauT family transport system permease protein
MGEPEKPDSNEVEKARKSLLSLFITRTRVKDAGEAASGQAGGQPAAAPPAAQPVPETKPTVVAKSPGARLRWLGIREEVPIALKWVLGVVPILVLLLAWTIATWGAEAETRIISPTILPSPLEVVSSFPGLWFKRELMRNLLISFSRVVAGFVVAVAIVFPLGVFMGSFSKVKAMFSPLSVFGGYLPIPTLVPLTMSLFGTEETQKIVFLALAFGIYLLPLIVNAVDAVDDTYLKTAYTLGANKQQVVSRVLLAISWPDIYQALRMGFGVGWSYILLAEIVDPNKGLGGIITTSQRVGPREHIYLVLLIIVGVAFLTDRLWVFVGQQIFPYRRAER